MAVYSNIIVLASEPPSTIHTDCEAWIYYFPLCSF